MSYSGAALAPKTGGRFVRGNNYTHSWDVHGLPTGSGWQLTAYNTDIYDHTLETRLFVDEFAHGGSDNLVVLPVDVSPSPVPDDSSAGGLSEPPVSDIPEIGS